MWCVHSVCVCIDVRVCVGAPHVQTYMYAYIVHVLYIRLPYHFTHLALTTSAPSGPPRMFTSSAQSRVITFSWAPILDEEQNGMILSYTITCDPFINPISVPDNMDMTTYTNTHHGFSPATHYTCTIVALTLDGNSPSATTTVTTMDDGNRSCSL